jgi:hypothetical protein
LKRIPPSGRPLVEIAAWTREHPGLYTEVIARASSPPFTNPVSVDVSDRFDAPGS